AVRDLLHQYYRGETPVDPMIHLLEKRNWEGSIKSTSSRKTLKRRVTDWFLDPDGSNTGGLVDRYLRGSKAGPYYGPEVLYCILACLHRYAPDCVIAAQPATTGQATQSNSGGEATKHAARLLDLIGLLRKTVEQRIIKAAETDLRPIERALREMG